MAESETKVPETNGMENDYLEEIKKLKETTVNKEEYDKMREENRRLLDTIVNGSTDKEETKTEEKVDIKALRADLFDNDHSNLEFAEKALALRKAIMDEGGEDPFLPNGKMISADGFDVDTANKVAEALQSCIDYANGDSQLFTNELQRITRDVVPSVRR